MNVIAVIPAWRRLDCLSDCLESLRDQCRVVVSPDADSPQRNATIYATTLAFGCGCLEASQQRLHCTGNTLRALEHAANSDATHVLRLDSDVVVTPTFVQTLLSVLAWAEHEGEEYAVGSSISYDYPSELKVFDQDKVTHIHDNGNNILLRNSTLRKTIKPLREFADRFCQVPPAQVDVNGARAWIRERSAKAKPRSEYMLDYAAAGVCGVSVDAVFQAILASIDCRIGFTYVNRAVLTSLGGENAKVIHAAKRQSVKLDLVAGDPDQDWRWHAVGS